MAEVQLAAIRAQGCGGQNVNKVSSAIHLRFDIAASSLPDYCKSRLLALKDSRLNQQGVLVIKAQQFRTQEQNRLDALNRLAELIRQATKVLPPRIPTRVSRAAKQRRLTAKAQHSGLKRLRQRPGVDT